MKPCKHKNLSYTGIQETVYKDQFLYLFNCTHCATTLSIPEDLLLSALFKAVTKLLKTKGENNEHNSSQKRQK